MSRTTVGLVSLAVALAFVGGLALGTRLADAQWREHAEATVDFELGGVINQLAMLEAGAEDKATEFLTWRLMAGVSSSRPSEEWTRLPAERQRTLLLAKRWLEKYPPERMPASVVRELEAIPSQPIEFSGCSRFVRELLSADGDILSDAS